MSQLDARSLAGRYTARGRPAADELHLTSIATVPEIRLHLAEDAILFWARLEADRGRSLPAPFWASAWAGGKAIARFVLDHPHIVAGKKVLDIGSGSGIAAIAAALSGGAVTANDTDPDAISAIALNTKANRVRVSLLPGDFHQINTNEFHVILVGDMLYHPDLATGMLQFLRRQACAGVTVLVGDPDRGNLPHDGLSIRATYPILDSGLSDATVSEASVFQVRP